MVGRDGVELILNPALSGVAGWRVTETDRQKRELVALRDEDVQARDGLNVVLTIDAAIQHIVETALADAHAKTRAGQHHRHRHAPAHGRNPGDGVAAEF